MSRGDWWDPQIVVFRVVGEGTRLELKPKRQRVKAGGHVLWVRNQKLDVNGDPCPSQPGDANITFNSPALQLKRPHASVRFPAVAEALATGVSGTVKVDIDVSDAKGTRSAAAVLIVENARPGAPAGRVATRRSPKKRTRRPSAKSARAARSTKGRRKP